MTAPAIRLTIADIEGAHLLSLVNDFVTLLGGANDMGDDALERLAPPAYPDDDQAASEFREATRGHLLDRRLEDALEVRSALEPFGETETSAQPQELHHRDLDIDPDSIEAWLRTLTAIRLVVASRLGIDKSDDHDLADPRFGIYDWLGFRLEQLIELADELDDV